MNERLENELRKRGLDGYVASTYQGVQYASGLRSATLQLFPRTAQVYAVLACAGENDCVIVSGRGDMDIVADLGAGFTGVGYGRFYRHVEPGADLNETERRLLRLGVEAAEVGSPAEALAQAIEQSGLACGRIGYEELPEQVSERVRALLPGTELVACPEALAAARLRKSVAEQAALAQVAQLTERAIETAVAIARPGVTEREMLTAFRKHLVEEGADPVVAFIRFGRNGGVCQVPAGSTALAPGDLIWFDVCADHDGYKSDIARSFVLGRPSDKAKRYYEALLAAEDSMIAAARPGVTAETLFDECVRVARESGIPHYQRHHVGHAIGLEVYETPLLAPGQQTRLEEDMVLNVEAPYYELAFGALHVEDPVVVRDSGGELLTRGSRELVSL